MIMTAREMVRRGDSPTSALKVSTEELKNIIRQVFRFPEPRSDSPLSDVTAAEPALDHRNSPLLPEKMELPTVPEHENETASFTTSASLNSSVKTATETPAPAPIISAPIPPAPAPPTTNKQGQSKPTSTPNKQETKPAPASPPKEDPKPKEAPLKTTPPQKQENELKSNTQGQIQLAGEEKAKPEAQENKKQPLSSRLADVGKGAGGLTSAKDAATSKDKDGDKSTGNKEAKDAKDMTSVKDVSGSLVTGQDPNETPTGTPLLNQDPVQPGTPTTGQSVMIRYYVQHQC